jgi:hypothetical protein
VVFAPVAGPPSVSDLQGGKRTGSLEEFRNFVRLSQAFDVIHVLGQMVEPQDIPLSERHLETSLAQLTLGDKAPYFYCRGAAQLADCFAMARIAHGIDEATFRSRPVCYTICNTNSPLQLDVPMTDGIVEFAANGQLVIVTPFTLAGAMAPITIAGALTLAHAEALLGITLTQAVRPGAPVMYGSFTSNVDMKSGSPAFGTPEYTKAAFGAGQLARRIGVPWRSSSATASNAPDAQSAYESQMSLWGALLGGCHFILHSAGWLEGGLTASYEKFILDVEMLQMFAEIFQPLGTSAEDLGVEAEWRLESAVTSSLRRIRCNVTATPSTPPWYPTGATTARGRMMEARAPRSARVRWRAIPWNLSNRPLSILLSVRHSRTSSHAAALREALFRSHDMAGPCGAYPGTANQSSRYASEFTGHVAPRGAHSLPTTSRALRNVRTS